MLTKNYDIVEFNVRWVIPPTFIIMAHMQLPEIYIYILDTQNICWSMFILAYIALQNIAWAYALQNITWPSNTKPKQWLRTTTSSILDPHHFSNLVAKCSHGCNCFRPRWTFHAFPQGKHLIWIYKYAYKIVNNTTCCDNHALASIGVPWHVCQNWELCFQNSEWSFNDHP